jgi:glutaconate CoA-transferase, subunit A
LTDKIISLQEAVSLVPDGAHMAIGGFTMVRAPMAVIYEMIRQRKANLHLFGHSPGIAWDMLIGAGCVKRVEVAYESDGAFGNVGPMFRRAIQSNRIEWEDYSNFGMICRFMAGSMGLPFFPTKSQLGSDIINYEGFTESLRQANPKIANKKLHIMNCPFTNEKIVLLPAINVDICVIHVQQATSKGNTRIFGSSFGDIQQALCARKVIVTCEEIVDDEILRKEPEHNQLPFYRVDHVVHLPYGAHPCACNNYYDYDPVQFSLYHDKTQTDRGFEEYLNEFVYSVDDHNSYLRKIGKERFIDIQADKGLGYRADLRRK